MKVSTIDNKLFELTAENTDDETLIDALHLGNHVHLDDLIRQATEDGGHRVVGATLCADAANERALRDKAGREALRAIGQLIGIGVREATNHSHIDGFTMNPKLQEKFAPDFIQLKLMADAISLAVGQLEYQGGIGAHNSTSSAATVSHPAPPPLPGQYWPEQQGWYAGIARSEDGQSHWHLILPDSTPETDFVSVWGTYGQRVDGAASRFNGLANTRAMAAAGCPAAIKVLAAQGNLHIPSQAELTLLAATLPEKFSSDLHWSSTQYSADLAFGQVFEYGYSCWSSKDNERRVRAVRGLALQPFSASKLAGIQA